MVGRWTVVLAAALVVAVAGRGEALLWCAAKSRRTGEVKEGKPVRLRTACQANELELDLAALGLQGPAGVAGAPGAAGEQGPPGDPGAPGLANVEVVEMQGNVIVTPSGSSTATAPCPGSKSILGGGFGIDNIGGATFTGIQSLVSHPVTTAPQGWTATMQATANDDWAVRAYAICADTAP